MLASLKFHVSRHQQGPHSSTPKLQQHQQPPSLFAACLPHLPPPSQGFITSEEFLSIPELSINPLAKRLSFLFESINFREFLGLLAPFSRAASRDDKLRCMFSVYDVDGDGAISEEDMEIVLRQLAGSSLSDAELKSIIAKVMRSGAASERGLTFPEYRAALEGLEVDLHVDTPVED